MSINLNGGNWFGVVFACFGSLFTIIGWGMAIMAARRLRTYQPVPATVLESTVISSTDLEGGTSHTPRIRYQYTAGGQTCESSSAHVLQFSTTASDAQRIIDQYPPGTKTQAYVNPADSTKAFLIHEATPFPYVFVQFSMIFVLSGLGIAMSETGWPTEIVSNQILIVTSLWIGMFAACVIHYRWVGGQMRLGEQLFVILCVGTSLIMLMIWDDYR